METMTDHNINNADIKVVKRRPIMVSDHKILIKNKWKINSSDQCQSHQVRVNWWLWLNRDRRRNWGRGQSKGKILEKSSKNKGKIKSNKDNYKNSKISDNIKYKLKTSKHPLKTKAISSNPTNKSKPIQLHIINTIVSHHHNWLQHHFQISADVAKSMRFLLLWESTIMSSRRYRLLIHWIRNNNRQ